MRREARSLRMRHIHRYSSSPPVPPGDPRRYHHPAQQTTEQSSITTTLQSHAEAGLHRNMQTLLLCTPAHENQRCPQERQELPSQHHFVVQIRWVSVSGKKKAQDQEGGSLGILVCESRLSVICSLKMLLFSWKNHTCELCVHFFNLSSAVLLSILLLLSGTNF